MANKILVERKFIDADGRERIERIDPREGVQPKPEDDLTERERREQRRELGRRMLRALGGWVN